MAQAFIAAASGPRRFGGEPVIPLWQCAIPRAVGAGSPRGSCPPLCGGSYLAETSHVLLAVAGYLGKP